VRQLSATAHVSARAGRVTRVYGGVMATGITPDAAAAAFRSGYAQALGTRADELQAVPQAGPAPLGLMTDRNTGRSKFWLYRDAQVRGAIPVYRGELRMLIKNEATNPVVWAAAALRDLGAFVVPKGVTPPAIDVAKSLRAASALYGSTGQVLPAPATLTRFSKPDLVIFAGVADASVPAVLGSKYIAESDNPPGRWEFVADVSTGDILHAESLMHAIDEPGTVNGNATQGADAAECALEVRTPLPYAEVAILGGSTGFSSQTGFFNLPNPGSTPVTVVARIMGQRFDIVNDAGIVEQLSLVRTPPNPANFLHNQANTQEFVRAQVNAYVSLNRVRDFLLGYVPTFPTISTTTDFSATVNSTSPGLCPGNAWFFGGSILFCAQDSGTSFSNTAFGSIAAHEFGHWVVQSGGSGQGEYGEGMSDTIAALLAEDPRLGLGFFRSQCNTPLRNADNDCQFSATNCSSCGSQIHACGQLLSGAIWDIRQQLMATNPTTFRDVVNALTLNSVLLHTGSGIDGDIAIDFLSLDDDDGNIANGTPHGTEICAGFRAHEIACPLAPARPCSAFCASPQAFTWTGSYQSGNLGTGAICRETTHPIAGGNCGNLAAGRTLRVNGVAMPCNNLGWPSVPPTVNGGYCVQTTAGEFPWAFYTLW
jgi:hypothetical protein